MSRTGHYVGLSMAASDSNALLMADKQKLGCMEMIQPPVARSSIKSMRTAGTIAWFRESGTTISFYHSTPRRHHVFADTRESRSRDTVVGKRPEPKGQWLAAPTALRSGGSIIICGL